MKSCIIVNFWADNNIKLDILYKCISQLKKSGIDIVYTSKYPISPEITSLCHLTIFTKKNDLIRLEDIIDNENITISNTMSQEIGLGKFYTCPLNFYNVSYSVYSQTTENLKFLKSLGYTHFHYLVGDCIISDEEIEKFELIEKLLRLTNKQAYFEDITKKFDGLSSLYFFSKIDFFLDNFKSFSSKQEFINTFENSCYENILLKQFYNNEEVFFIKNDKWEYGHLLTFQKSEIDLISSYNTSDVYAIIPNKENDFNHLIILSKNGGEYTLKINEETYHYSLSENFWQSYNIFSKEFNLKILKNDNTEFEMYINEKRFKKILSYSYFA